MRARHLIPRGPARRVLGREAQAGAAFVFVMAFMGLITAMLAAMTAFALASEKSVKSYRKDRAVHYAADAALEAGVQYVKQYNQLGTSLMATPGSLYNSCSLQVPIVTTPTVTTAYAGAGVGIPTITSTSFLTVECAATYATQSGGNTGGAQGVRDVTFSVICNYNNATKFDGAASDVTTLSSCGSTGTRVVLAQARVQYQIDLNYVKTDAVCSVSTATGGGDPKSGPLVNPSGIKVPTKADLDNAESYKCAYVAARVPKIVTWTTYRL